MVGIISYQRLLDMSLELHPNIDNCLLKEIKTNETIL